jgi:hypothetical protein
MASATLDEQKPGPWRRVPWEAIGYLSAGCMAVAMAGIIPNPTPFQLTALNLISAVALGSFALHIPIGTKLAALPAQLAAKSGFVLIVSALAFPAPSTIGPAVRAELGGLSSRQEQQSGLRLPAPAAPVAPQASSELHPACDTIDAAAVARLLSNAAGASSVTKALSPVGTREVVALPDGSLELFDTKTGKLVWQSSFTDGSAAHSVAFTPDQARIVSVQTNGSLLALDPNTGKPLWGYPQWSAQNAAISPDSTRIVAVLNNNSLAVLDTATGKELLTIPTSSQALYAVFSPDGRFIVAKLKSGREQAWTAEGAPCASTR